MKIFDTFLFNNELDLLEVRLRLLYQYVDCFVIQESDYTHSGKLKPLYFDLNRYRFEWAAHKIIHLIMWKLQKDPG